MMWTVTIDQSEGISGADIPEQAIKLCLQAPPPCLSPAPARFSHSYYRTTFHHHLGAWNRLLLGWQFLSPNFPIDCHLSSLYQTFNVTVQTRAAVSLASRLVLTIFFFFFIVLQLSNNFSLSSFHASFASFCGASATVVWLVADFCRPIFYSVG